MYLVLSPDLYIITASNLYLQAVSARREDITGKHIFEAFPDNPDLPDADGVQNINASLQEVLRTRKPHFMPIQRYDVPDIANPGKFIARYWDPSHTPVLNEAGQVVYIIQLATNITDQILTKQALAQSRSRLTEAYEEVQVLNEELTASNEELMRTQEGLNDLNNELEQRIVTRTAALSESENQFKQLADSIIQMIWVTDAEGYHEYYNKRWYDFTGTTYEQTQGEGWNEIFHPDDRERAWKIWNHSLQTGDPYEIEYRLRKYTGEYAWVLGRAAPYFDVNGRIVKWFGTCTDIDELKQLQQQKDDFISIASHELKTPLTSLSACIQLLYRVKDNPQAGTHAKLIEQASKSCQKVSSLVNDLLNVSKLTNGQLHVNYTTFNIAALATDCCQHFLDDGRHQVITTGDVHLQVTADEDRIKQVLVNFINNAIKYAPQSPNIAIHIQSVAQAVKVSVTDAGPGIPADKQKHLFDKYYRADNSGIQYSGLGLGLYICSQIIQKHDGEIGVESEMGKGSTFWFTIPLSPGDDGLPQNQSPL
ncbi:hypothetical protein A0256_02580 [Mucilaginibacter sp. PAMC 26640]|nr:hypothetical protein A0256_02580 [Mucilaginibacter sp. PAMC 26640]